MRFSLVVCFCLIVSCCGTATQTGDSNVLRTSEVIPTPVATPVPPFKLESIDAETLRSFDAYLPQETRTFLQTAKRFGIWVQKRESTVEDEESRKDLLNALNWDAIKSIEASKSRDAVACVDPDYGVWVEDHDENLLQRRITVSMSFYCGKIGVNDVFAKKIHYIEGLNGSNSISKSVFDRIIGTSPDPH